jgi:DNA-binding transcriptional ArsR family regulator
MATAAETLQATLSETEYRALVALSETTEALSGRRLASALGVSPTTANEALGTLAEAGFATSERAGRARLWRLAVTHPSICDWLEESMPPVRPSPSTSSPYSTGGGGVRLEHTYAVCLIAGMLAGEALTELGDSLTVHSIRLQASDVSEADDILVEGRDAQAVVHRASIAVRRSPNLTRSDSASVPLFRDFVTVVIDQWSSVAAGQWRLVLAVSTNANAIAQLAELAELARSVPSGEELERRLAQPGRTSAPVRDRYKHVKALVEQAAEGLTSASGLTGVELTWRVLSSLTVRSLRLERTDRTDRTVAVNILQRVVQGGTPAKADALFSRLEELVGRWAPQAAVLTQSVIRRSLSEYPLSRSPRFDPAWAVIDRLGLRLRDSIRPVLGAGTRTLELERPMERSRLDPAMRTAGIGPGALVVTGDPDLGKSALTLRVAEVLQVEGAAVTSISLRDLPLTSLFHEAPPSSAFSASG